MPNLVSAYRYAVASSGFGDRRGMKPRENNSRLTHKNNNYYELHAINNDKAIGLYILY